MKKLGHLRLRRVMYSRTKFLKRDKMIELTPDHLKRLDYCLNALRKSSTQKGLNTDIDWDDVRQEAVLSILEGKVNPDGNIYYAAQKGLLAVQKQIPADIPTGHTGATTLNDGGMTQAEVDAFINENLGGLHREVFVLYMNGTSLRGIASELGLPANRREVSRYLSEAQSILKGAL